MDNSQLLDEVKNLLLSVNAKIDRQNEKIEVLENRLLIIEQNKVSQKSDSIVTEALSPSACQEQAERQQTQEINFIEPSKVVKENFEEKLGGKWFAKIGIAVLLIGVSLFLKYAFDNNWISPAGRISIGIFAGLAMLVLGNILIKKYFNYGQIISGGGIAVLYFSIFAAFDFYHMIPAYAAFIAMATITAAAMFLSLYYNAVSLITVAIVGGFAAPFLCSSGTNNQIGLFSYLLILDLAIFLISFVKKWRQINLLGFLGTALLFMVWYAQFYDIKQLPATLFFLTLFFFIYSISPLAYNLFEKEISKGEEQILTLFAGVAYFGSVYGLMNAKYHAWMGLFALGLGVYYLIWAYLVRLISSLDKNLYSFLAFLSAGFVAIAIPVQFKYYTITIGWMMEALILLYIGARQESSRISEDGKDQHNIAIILGSSVAFMAVFRLLFFDSVRILQNEVFLLNKRFGVFLFVIMCLYIAGYIFMRCVRAQVSKDRVESLKNIMVAMFIAANLLTIFALSKEIINYHDREINVLRIEQNSLYDNKGYYINGANSNDAAYYKLQDKIKTVQYRSSIVLSLFWLLYAIILLIIGFAGLYKAIRIGGILLLVFSIAKLFFYDLWRLGTLYRIISSMSLGVVLLLISFAYQKYKDKIKEIV